LVAAAAAPSGDRNAPMAALAAGGDVTFMSARSGCVPSGLIGSELGRVGE